VRLDGLGELYHTGTVVDDLEAAMASTRLSLGIEWTRPVRSHTEVWTPDGTRVLSLMWTYSLDEGHRIELIQQFDDIGPSERFHMPSEPHFGYWVTNADAARARLEAAGLPTCFARVSDGETLVSYHRSPWGFFVELVSEKARPALQALLDGGATWGGIG
jgi:hypothetical protein